MTRRSSHTISTKQRSGYFHLKKQSKNKRDKERNGDVQNFNENLAVSQLAEVFAISLGKSKECAKQIGLAASLHDVGKKLIDPAIINKPDKLTPEEFEIMKTHTNLGAWLMYDIPGDFGKMVSMVCKYHHEWHNGEGYWKIPTSQLPDYIPIISIVDVFVACLSSRSYKDAWPPERVLEYLEARSDTQFSSHIVDSFIHLIRNNKEARAIFSEANTKGDDVM